MAPDEATRLRVEKIGLSCDFMDMVQMDKGPRLFFFPIKVCPNGFVRFSCKETLTPASYK